LLTDPDEKNVCGGGACTRGTSEKGRHGAMHFMTPVISFLMALAAPAMGCSVAFSPAPPPIELAAGEGSMTVHWSVVGTFDPAQCDAFGATTMEVIIYDASGHEFAHANAPCDAFSVSVPLPEGTYSAEATLIDPVANARSVTKPLQAIQVVAGTDLAIDLDFPPGSML
jgi:hypothetical protein